MRRIWILALVTGWLGLCGAAVLGAQTGPDAQAPGNQDAQQDAQAPPTPNTTVARLSSIEGSVSTQRGDTGEWDAGAINTPLVNGDKVSTGADGRAEVQLDYADFLRLAGGAQANLVELGNSDIKVQMAAGTADYVVLSGAQANSEIDTPNIAVHPRGAGVFRIEVVSPSETDVIVRQGEADISTPQGSTPLKQGQLIVVQGTDTPQYKISDAPAEDAFDQWNHDRDNKVVEAASIQKTNPYYTGVQDLDGHGYWTVVPGYGQVWVPNEASNWTPYSDGRWDYEPYWGWTWVGYESWGWAPYHYGRWFLNGASWAWWPGPVTPYYRPIWAPAYVSFFGWGGGVGFGVGFGGFGSIGWLPIGPCDPFMPWWGGFGFRTVGYGYGGWRGLHGRGIVRPLAGFGVRGRIAYSNLDALRTNARMRDGLVRVSSSAFARGGAGAREHVSAAELRGSSMMRGSLPVRATRGSMNLTRRVSSAAAQPRNAATHFFNSRGAAGTRAEAATRASGGESARGAANARDVESARGAASGMHSFERGAEAPVHSAARSGNSLGARENAASSAGTRAGWQRFSGSAAAGGARPEIGGARSLSSGGARTAASPGWQRFSPESRAQQADHGNGVYGGNSARSGNYGANRGPEGRSLEQGRSMQQSRPPLQVGRPIMQAPRDNSSHPGYGGEREMSAPRSAPSYGGGREMSAPRSAPSRGGGGGGHASGGGSHGGGGGHGGHGR